MSFFQRVLNLGKGLVRTTGRSDPAAERALEEEMVAERSPPRTPVVSPEPKAPAREEHPATDPLSRPPAKRTL